MKRSPTQHSTTNVQPIVAGVIFERVIARHSAAMTTASDWNMELLADGSLHVEVGAGERIETLNLHVDRHDIDALNEIIKSAQFESLKNEYGVLTPDSGFYSILVYCGDDRPHSVIVRDLWNVRHSQSEMDGACRFIRVCTMLRSMFEHPRATDGLKELEEFCAPFAQIGD